VGLRNGARVGCRPLDGVSLSIPPGGVPGTGGRIRGLANPLSCSPFWAFSDPRHASRHKRLTFDGHDLLRDAPALRAAAASASYSRTRPAALNPALDDRQRRVTEPMRIHLGTERRAAWGGAANGAFWPRWESLAPPR